MTMYLQMRGSDMPTTRPPLLLATDRSASIIQRAEADSPRISYNPFGFHPRIQQSALLGFNGQPYGFSTNVYLLGSGYRAFNVILQRFTSPDSYSPFGAGGLNGYAYCAADPVNNVDPSGHIPIFKSLKRAFGFGKKTPRAKVTTDFFPEGIDDVSTRQILNRLPANANTNRAILVPGQSGASRRPPSSRNAPPQMPPTAPPSSLVNDAPPRYSRAVSGPSSRNAFVPSAPPEPASAFLPPQQVGSMTAPAPTTPPAVQRSNASSASVQMDLPPAYDSPPAFETLIFSKSSYRPYWTQG